LLSDLGVPFLAGVLDFSSGYLLSDLGVYSFFSGVLDFS
jgi:hypothetical protein